MRDRIKADRFAITMGPGRLGTFEESAGAWHETPTQVEQGLEWGRKKAIVLVRIRQLMHNALTPHQFRYLELYYFRGLSHRQIGILMGVNASTACRTVRRAVKRLKKAIAECPEDLAGIIAGGRADATE